MLLSRHADCHVWQERRSIYLRASDEFAQLRCFYLDDHGRVEAVHALVHRVERAAVAQLMRPPSGRGRATEPHVQEVLRNGGEPLQARESSLELQRGLFDLAWRDEYPPLGHKRLVLWKVAEEALQRLSAPEEVLPRLVETREKTAHRSEPNHVGGHSRTLAQETIRSPGSTLSQRSTIGRVEEFVPRDVDVPRRLETPQFVLEPLGPEHNDQDYDAWTSSEEHIHATPGWKDSSWPREMTPDENRADLQRHADDFRNRTGFTYTVLEPASRDVIGCVYIYPLPDSEYDARALSWVRASHAQLDTTLWRAVTEWLASDWPFGSVEYAPRG